MPRIGLVLAIATAAGLILAPWAAGFLRPVPAAYPEYRLEPPYEQDFIEDEPARNAQSELKLVLTFIISLISLISGIFIILSKRYQEAELKWAYGTVGGVICYWMGRLS